MSFISNLEALFQKDEAWVIGFFVKLKTDLVVVEADLVAAISWMSAHGAEISADIAALIPFVGIASPPIAAALTGLNVAVALVNKAAAAAAAAKASGASDTSVLIAAAQDGVKAYNELKAVQVLTATAQAAVATGTATAK